MASEVVAGAVEGAIEGLADVLDDDEEQEEHRRHGQVRQVVQAVSAFFGRGQPAEPDPVAYARALLSAEHRESHLSIRLEQVLRTARAIAAKVAGVIAWAKLLAFLQAIWPT